MKRLAVERGLAVFQPEKLHDVEIERIAATRPQVLAVAAYGLILPPRVLDITPRGALNIHASLLPRWRGAAPIQRALLAGDRETGISIMQMDAGLDTGPVLAQHPIAIAANDDAGTLHAKLATQGAEAIERALVDIETGRARAVPQSESGATYAAKIDKRETRLDWSRPALVLERAVRAFRPAPGAFAMLDGEPVKIWQASVAAAGGEPGTILQAGQELLVACGEQALAISALQRAGGRRLSAQEFLRGHPLAPGARFA